MINKLMSYNKKEAKEKLDFSDLCIYTSTKYGNDKVSQTRYPLAIKTLKNCENLGITTIVVDSSSNEKFLSQLQTIKNIKILHNDEQMGKKRRIALQDAIDNTDAKYFLWMEPEKYDLVKDTSLLDMINSLKSGNNIVVPRRDNIDQMPEFFAWIEKRGMKRANIEAMDSAGEYDLRFGPKMFDRKSAKYFLDYNHNHDRADLRDSHIIPTIQAHKDGLHVQSVEVDYQYDHSEINIEVNRELKQKRLDQYKSILLEIIKEG